MILSDLGPMAETGAGLSVYYQAYEMLQSLVNLTCISEIEQEQKTHCLEAQGILKEAEAELDRNLQQHFESE